MGRRGPKSAPNHLKVLQGVTEGRINREEPIPKDGPVVPPVQLSEGAQEIWQRLAPDLIQRKVLTRWDTDLFTVFCEATATFHECKAMMGREYANRTTAGSLAKSPYFQIMRDCEAMMSRVGGRFGLTPGDRASLKVDENGGSKSGAERYLS